MLDLDPGSPKNLQVLRARRPLVLYEGRALRLDDGSQLGRLGVKPIARLQGRGQGGAVRCILSRRDSHTSQ